MCKTSVKNLLVAVMITWGAIAVRSQTVPAIVRQFPVTYGNSLTIFNGASPTFSVLVTNVSPVGYQWMFNGLGITGATSNTYTVTNAQAGADGVYACAVTGIAGSVTNVPWTLSVIPAPSAPYPQTILADNPAGYWRLNEGPDNGAGNAGTVCEDYAAGDDGIYTNVLLAQQPGYSMATEPTEPAVQFATLTSNNSDVNGIQNVDFSTPTNSSANFSIEAWVNGATVQTSTGGVVAKGWGGGGEQFVIDIYNHLFRFFIRDASGGSHSVTSTFLPGGWHHLVGVCNETGGALTLYVDGVAASSSTAVKAGFGLLASTNLMSIGARMGSAAATLNDQFTGYIDDVAVYRYALTANQVLSHYLAAGIPPRITKQPVAATNATLNGLVTVPVSVMGTAPLVYQWFDENAGTYLPAQPNPALIISNVTAGDTYYLTVSNAFGFTNSTAVTVNLKPVIISQLPASVTNVLTLFAGASPAFSVSVASAQAVSYRWAFNGTVIAGATNASYILTNAQTANSGVYACVVTSATGSVTNVPLTVAVVAPPTAPYPEAVVAAGPTGYWRLNEGPDNGTGNQGAICEDYIGGHDGIYTNVTLAQLPGYSQSTEPAEPAVEFGETGLSLHDSDANGIQGIDFSSPTNSNLSIEAWVNGFSQQINGAGLVSKGWGGGGEQFALDIYGNYFRFLVRTAAGSGYTAVSKIQPDGNWHHLAGVCDELAGVMTLYVDGTAAAITALPTGSGILTATNFMVIGARMSNATTNNNYQFYGYLSDVAAYSYALSPGQVQSHYWAAGIAPSIIAQPVTGTNIGVSTTLTVTAAASGTPPLAYAWFDVNAGSYLAGQTNATLVISNIAASDSYYLTVTNLYGETSSTPVTVQVIAGAPQIVTDVPTALFAVAGSTVSISATVGGSQPLFYQWQFNGADLADSARISGTQSNVLTIENVQAGDAGAYELMVTNSYGSAASSVAALAVGSQPVSFNGDGTGWVPEQTGSYANETASLTNDILYLTDGGLNQARSFFFQVPQYIGAFTAAFTYQDVGGGGADGVAFVVQNDPRGAAALGGPGGNLGVKAGSGSAAITPSAALEFNIYDTSSNGGYGLFAGGAVGQDSLPGDVNLDSGDPLAVTINYGQGIMAITMTDAIANTSFSTNLNIGDLTQLVGGTNTAYVGFTGSAGGITSTQTITGFSFVSIPQASIEKQGANVIISWPGNIPGYVLQQSSSLTAGTWEDTTNASGLFEGQYQFAAPLNGTNQFFRLKLQ